MENSNTHQPRSYLDSEDIRTFCVMPSIFQPGEVVPVEQSCIEFFNEHLLNPTLRETKDGPCFSLAQFQHTQLYRNDENAQELAGLVLDIDNSEQIDGRKQCIRNPTLLGHIQDRIGDTFYFFYTSFSHDENWPRFRIVLPTDRDITISEWDQAYAGLLHILNGLKGIDAKSGSRSQAYYLPACPVSRRKLFASEINHGQFIKVSALLTLGKEAQNVKVSVPDALAFSYETLPIFRRLSNYQEKYFTPHKAGPKNYAYLWEHHTCPFNPAHTNNSAYFTLFSSGKWGVGCHHDSCKNKTKADLYPNFEIFLRDVLLGEISNSVDSDQLVTSVLAEISASDFTEVNVHLLLSAIKKKTGIPLGALRADLQSNCSLQGNAADHLEYAKKLVSTIGADNLICCQSSLWRWNGKGLWILEDDRTIKQTIQADLDDKLDVSSNTVTSVLDLMKSEVNRPNHHFDIDSSTINCKNGELHFEENKWTLKSHCREHFRTAQIPVAYDADALAPRFVQFLDEIFRGDSDKELKKKVVLEAIGYSLLTATNLETFFLLVGSGANGKTVLMDTLAALCGSANIAAVAPEELSNRFQIGHLRGRLANIVAEIRQGATLPDAELKKLVSGEIITAEEKFKPPFEFRPSCTCWFGTNHLPYTKDFSEALFRRAVVLTFNNTFTRNKCDPMLKSKLRTELSGILNLALDALAQLFVRDPNQFTLCPSSEEAKARWRSEIDPVSDFVEDKCSVSSLFSVRSSALYQSYKAWSLAEGLKPLAHRSVTTRLRRFGVEPARGTAGKRFLNGIKLA